ncbi:MAG: GntR family transcriptional regulator, partial [Clostridia bacterium]|nr:GntR family transcriptional regulator [Clostridia bacterium]
MNIIIDRTSKTPVYIQLATQIKQQIQHGEFAEGAALPSERSLSKILGIHRNTVAKAYGLLQSEAYLDSRQGVGHIVALGGRQDQAGVKVASLGEASVRRYSERPKKVSWTYEIKDEFLNREKSYDNLFERHSDESKSA